MNSKVRIENRSPVTRGKNTPRELWAQSENSKKKIPVLHKKDTGARENRKNRSD